eukprot:1497074-Prymnesium_polylepis.1
MLTPMTELKTQIERWSSGGGPGDSSSHLWTRSAAVDVKWLGASAAAARQRAHRGARSTERALRAIHTRLDFINRPQATQETAIHTKEAKRPSTAPFEGGAGGAPQGGGGGASAEATLSFGGCG